MRRTSLILLSLLAIFLIVQIGHAQEGTPPPPTPTLLPTPTPISKCPPGLDDTCNWVVAAQNEWGLPKFTWALVLAAVMLILAAIGRGLLKRGESIGEKLPDDIWSVFSRRSAIRRYLKVFIQQNKFFGFRGMEMLALQPIELSHAYVQLDLFFETTRQAREKSDEEQKDATWVRDAVGGQKTSRRLAQMLDEGGKRLAIIGDAGSGKSALLQWVGLAIAHDYQWHKLSSEQKELVKAVKVSRIFRPLLPLIIPLRKYHTYCQEKNISITPDSLYTFIQEYSQREYKKENLPDGLFCYLLRHGCLLMFDGVDEVDFPDRPAIRSAVEGIVDDDKNCKRNVYIVTTRPSAKEIAAQLAGFETAIVQPLTTEKRQNLIELWCEAVYPTATDADNKSADLFRRIQDDLVRDMAGTPLMVNIFALVYFHRRDLPSQRAELFEYAVLALLTDPHKQGQAVADSTLWGGRQLQQRRDDMALIAFILHDSGKDDVYADKLINNSLFWKRFGTEKENAQQKASEFLDLA
jgi:predicted NACHT family NTPase